MKIRLNKCEDCIVVCSDTDESSSHTVIITRLDDDELQIDERNRPEQLNSEMEGK